VVRIGEAVAIAHEATDGGELAQEVHRRDSVAGSKRDDLFAAADEECIVGQQ
jgi:hypothetical protein